mgnify:CR=1 FL=1
MKHTSKLFAFVIFLLAIGVVSGGEEEKTDFNNMLDNWNDVPDGTSATSSEDTALETDIASGEVKIGTEVTKTSDGLVAKGNVDLKSSTNNQVKGDVDVDMHEDGAMTVRKADQVTTSQGAKANGVKNGNVYSNGYYDFGSVNSLIDGPFKVLNGENVKHDSTGFSVGSGENVQQEGVMSGQVSDYSGDDNSFNVGSADSVCVFRRSHGSGFPHSVRQAHGF